VATTPAGAPFVNMHELKWLTDYPVRSDFRVPIVVAPNVNPALARHPAFRRAISLLRDWGVEVLHDPSAQPPTWMNTWDHILDTAIQQVRDPSA